MIRSTFLPGLFLAVFTLLAPPPASACRGAYPTHRACWANQKTLAGALEMYALDFNVQPKVFTPKLAQTLKDNGYLQSIPRDPGFRSEANKAGHYQLIENPFPEDKTYGNDRRIMCIKHGVITDKWEKNRPRDFLIASGITDPALLRDAAEIALVPQFEAHRRWKTLEVPEYPVRLATRLLAAALFPFQSQMALWVRLQASWRR